MRRPRVNKSTRIRSDRSWVTEPGMRQKPVLETWEMGFRSGGGRQVGRIGSLSWLNVEMAVMP